VLIFIARRLLSLPLVMLGVSLLIFGLTQFLSPELRATAFIRSEKQIHQIPAIIKAYGLDKDIFTQYWIWLKSVLQGNLGWSASSGRPVADALAIFLPATVELALAAIIPIVLFGVIFGIVAGVNRNKWPDQVGRIFSIVTFSLPTFLVGMTLQALFYGQIVLFEPGRLNTIASLDAGLKSVDGYLLFPLILKGEWSLVGDLLKHLVLPVVTLVIVLSGGLMRVVRSSVIDQLEQDYVRTAKAKGLEQRRITFKHVFRNALIPVITLVGTLFFGLLNGAIITETVFNYPGVGNFVGNAALQFDIPAVLGFALFAAMIITISNLVVDLLYGVVDPRIRYD
jgi:dipeptide transport system permease protein